MSTPTKSQGLHAMNHGVATPPSSEQTILVPFVDFDHDVFSKFVSILGVTEYPQSVLRLLDSEVMKTNQRNWWVLMPYIMARCSP